MIITDPKQLDLTGSDSSYERTLRRFKIFTANQLVDLQDAAYLNTIRVYEITGFDENNNPVLRELNAGNSQKEWSTDATNIDVAATSKAKVYYKYTHPTFLQTTDTHYVSGKTYYYRNYVSGGSITDETGTYDYELLNTYTIGAAIPATPILYEMNQDTWDFTLVNGFFMNDSATDLLSSGEYEIAVSYQGLELECSAVDRDNLGPEYSPGLMRSILDKVEELYYVRNPIKNTFATTVADMHCLDEDLTGAKHENWITGEVHHVDVANNLFVIRPQCGSFYNTDTLELYFQGYDPADSTATISTNLVKDVDYVVTGMNKEKTAISEPSCGVYEYIVLKKSYTGKVYLSYQAFGGEVTQADINMMKEIIQNIYQTVYSSDIVTLNNLPQTSIIKELIYRQQLLEHTIGHYQSQSFKYNTSNLDKFVNIAFVDRNPWTADAPVPTSCVGEFRIKIPIVDFFMDVKVNYDVNASEPFSVSVYHVDIPTFEKNAFDYFRMRILPKFRVIWCSTNWTEDNVVHPATDRGIMLQMSMTSVEAMELDVTVEDVTGAKSPWDLVDTRGLVRPSTDTHSVEYYTNNAVRYGKFSENNQGIRTYVFDWKASIDKSSDIVPLYPKGYTIFVGRVPITQIEAASVNHSLPDVGNVPEELTTGYDAIVPCITGQDIDLSKVKSVEFKVLDRLTEKYVVGRSERLISKNNLLVAEAIYFVDDLCLLSCSLALTNGSYTIKLFSRTGTNSLNNDRFDLVQIDLIG